MKQPCAPALIYLAFSLAQIIIDLFNNLYNTAFMKSIVMIIITILLNTLCQEGMGVVSWIIVFVPFIFMTTIVAILLFIFGMDPTTGTVNQSSKGGNLIYTSTETETTEIQSLAPYGSSDPQFS
jgi:predicted membrane protein